MSQRCDVCGKSPSVGNRLEQRGKAKYLGGNGRKTTGITRRKFKPNLQKIRVQDGEKTASKKVWSQCIRSGRIQKAVVRAPFTLPKQS
ncbi:MAG: 50S ribosomal protein L28 [Planctomycetaceae bacterium]|nr:50S ribosomal protein L28 [Planctomycetaceae bacterium]